VKLIASATIFPVDGKGRQATIWHHYGESDIMRQWGKPLAAFCIAASLAVIGSWAQAAPNSAPPPPLEARRVSLTSVDSKGGKATALYG
ncbi:hypothetical protein ABTK13_21145, partial [Acinetobacter baumannii]